MKKILLAAVTGALVLTGCSSTPAAPSGPSRSKAEQLLINDVDFSYHRDWPPITEDQVLAVSYVQCGRLLSLGRPVQRLDVADSALEIAMTTPEYSDPLDRWSYKYAAAEHIMTAALLYLCPEAQP